MNTVYTPSASSEGTPTSKGLIALALTLAIFAVLPTLHLIPNLLPNSGAAPTVATAPDSPPVVTIPPEVKPEEKEKLEKPEFDKPKLTLTQIEAIGWTPQFSPV